MDILYRKLQPRSQALLDLLGCLLWLLPVSAVLFLISIDYVSWSWKVRETSPEPGGLPALFLLKSLLLIMPALLFLQGLSELAKAWLKLFPAPAPEAET